MSSSSQDVSIDIQLKKLLDWLVSRRVCPHDWHQHIPTIRDRLTSAVQSVSDESALTSLLSSSLETEQPVDYFLAKDILSVLKSLDADTKNVFGGYSSDRVTVWMELVDKLWPKSSAFLGDSAQILSRIVVFEVPAAKKRLSRSLQVQQECDKNEKDNLRKANELYKEYKKACHGLNIDPEDDMSLRKQILKRLEQLPVVYEDVARSAKTLKDAIEHYGHFVQNVHGKMGNKDEELKDDHSNLFRVLPTLRFLVERGDVSVYEWRHGEAPLKLEQPKLDLEDEESKNTRNDDTDDVIDFGDDDANNDIIDFGDEIELDNGANIDWGGLELEGSGDNNIDWSHVEVVGDDAIIVEEVGVDGGVARGEEALSMLDNRNTRALILDELTELECFIQQRIKEDQASDQMSMLGLSIDMGSSSSLSSWLSSLRSLTSTLTSTQVHHMQLIRSSPKYVDRLLDSLRSKKALEERARKNNEQVKITRTEAMQEQTLTQERIDRLIATAKRLQKNLEEDISKRYNNRQVNILLGF